MTLLNFNSVVRGRRFVLKSGLILMLAAAMPKLALADTAADAQQFISNLGDQAIKALTDSSASRAEREDKSRELLKDYFSVPTIARFVLGRYWNDATPEQQQEYLKLFEDLIVQTYVSRFSDYKGETLTVGRAVVSDGGDVVVSSEISRPGGAQPVNVDWRVRQRDGAFKIVDVFVEGVSMGVTQRQEFASVIRNNNNQISGLLDEMRRRIAAKG